MSKEGFLESGDQAISFEWDSRQERLEIHGTSESLRAFARRLESLASAKESDHLHLMTQDWGGAELSGEQQNPDAALIHHVKVLMWK